MEVRRSLARPYDTTTTAVIETREGLTLLLVFYYRDSPWPSSFTTTSGSRVSTDQTSIFMSHLHLYFLQ